MKRYPGFYDWIVEKQTTYILCKNWIRRVVFFIYTAFSRIFLLNTLYISIIFLEPLLLWKQTCVNQISFDTFVLKTFRYKPFMFIQNFDLTSSFWFIPHFSRMFMMDTLYELTWNMTVSLIIQKIKSVIQVLMMLLYYQLFNANNF